MSINTHARRTTLALMGTITLLSVNAHPKMDIAEPVKDVLPSDEHRLSVPFYTIFVGEVVSLEGNGIGTNSSPPRGTVRVLEALRGHLDPSEYTSVWEASIRHSDMVDPKNMDYTLKDEWKRKTMAAPGVGTKFIGFAKYNKKTNALYIAHENIYKNSADNRDSVKRNAVPPERTGIIQWTAALLVILLPVLSLAFLWKNPRVSLVLAMAVFPIYIFYESGISSWANIRIDLLLIVPMLLVAIIMTFVAGFKTLIPYVRSDKS